ncbi:GntR family transcriptional regulator [Palleronia sp. LCG004]|uniref:GntR family transcriptional regulator n=1 Tax=Palleronia sp. LCG004 TaxID=3079304 RepID=UPI002941BBD8|nr:GntR family transcriptional regulator [Palleronia sp. LCG004]WOI57334.1 GntR family transcriptional regulator [Palleronia sp. LCG004]
MSGPSAAPIYLQIADLLIRRIAQGSLIEGERLPPERDMAADHGVAVGTLRKALNELHAQGLLERRQGSGNYVRGVREVGGLYGFFRLERPDGPGLPDARILSVEIAAKPAGSPPFGSAPDAHRIRRLRLLDDLPVAVEEIWLDRGRAPSLDPEAMLPSLYQTYRQLLGLRIVRIEDRVGVGPLPAWGSGPLDRRTGAVTGQVARVSWSQDGDPVEYSTTWFDPDRVRYVSRLK